MAAGSKLEIESRIVRIKMNDGSQVNGQVNIKRDPGYDRLSDLVGSKDDPFLVVFNATLYESGVGSGVRHEAIFINKKHIVYATPEIDQK